MTKARFSVPADKVKVASGSLPGFNTTAHILLGLQRLDKQNTIHNPMKRPVPTLTLPQLPLSVRPFSLPGRQKNSFSAALPLRQFSLQPTPFHPSLHQHGQNLEAAGFPEDLIPEKFKCAITNKIMSIPVELPTKQICDGASLLERLMYKPVNPFSDKDAMEPEDAKPAVNPSKTSIDAYVAAILQGIQEKAKGQSLSRTDYVEIHTAVCQEMGLEVTTKTTTVSTFKF